METTRDIGVCVCVAEDGRTASCCAEPRAEGQGMRRRVRLRVGLARDVRCGCQQGTLGRLAGGGDLSMCR
jgi:hypothetical protein